jgi:NADPH:quinone reductase-like Zn-dependent oxidoreductase
MKALLCDRYGPPDVLRLGEAETPTPADDEVLVRVVAVTVNRSDTQLLSGKPFPVRLVFGFLRPKRNIPGSDFAGEVIAVGRQVNRFAVGERVFGFRDQGSSSHAEYLSVKHDTAIAPIPEGVSFADAAASCEGPFYAQNSLRRLDLKPGQRVLVNGASGGIGTAAVQLAKHAGAYVVGVCGRHAFDVVKDRGADSVIDYTEEDFVTRDDAPYDFILDTVGNRSYLECKNRLTADGVYGSSELGPWGQNVLFSFQPRALGGRAMFPIPSDLVGCLEVSRGLLESGDYRPVLDREFSFDDIIDAYQYVVKGEKLGNVIVNM